MQERKAILWVAATPIGNLDDVTPSLRRVLSEADLILCEDTRRAGQLLHRCGLPKKPLQAYHDHNEEVWADRLIERICTESLAVCLISDAGTPTISDPGYRLVRAAAQAGLRVSPIAGPCAGIALLSVSGLPTDRFSFVGFLPRKPSERAREFASWKGTVIFYESLRRISKSLEELREVCPDARVVVGRELTKLHEEIVRGSVDDILSWAKGHAVLKGELTVVVYVSGVSGEGLSSENLKERIIKAIVKGEDIRSLVRQFGEKAGGLPRAELYRMMLEHHPRSSRAKP